MDAERKLAELWAEDAPPARDPAFNMRVLAQLERRRLQSDVADAGILLVVGGVLAWLLAPTLENMLNGGDSAGFGATALLLTLSVVGGIWLAAAAARATEA